MLANVGHTIQKMINNTPVAVTTNEKSTTVVTNGGNVYQSGLINGKIVHSFNEIASNGSLIGKVVDSESTDNKTYLLSESGSVFEYSSNSEIGPIVREVYSQTACGGGDKAVKIASGKSHVLILTESGKVWGAGANNEYQLVPQGQCKYDTATEILITDINLHDNECPNAFTGIFNELLCPVIPTCSTKCNQISCIKDTKCDIVLGYLNISQTIVTPPGGQGILSVPVYGDISYVGFLCVDNDDCASGTLTYTITRLYIKCGCFVSKFTTNDNCGCHEKEFNTSSTTEILIFEATGCPVAKTDICAAINPAPITGTSQIEGKCGSCAIVNIDLPKQLSLPEATYDFDCKTILLQLRNCRTSLAALCDATFCGMNSDYCVDLDLDFDVSLDCCKPTMTPKVVATIPQPCWTGIYAGGDVSVLLDSCNRIYTLGSLYKVRSNSVAKGSCLEELLNKTNTSVSFPADQLNCAMTKQKSTCKCRKCTDKEKDFKTDLSKFGINLSFPSADACDKDGKGMNVCDFLSQLKNCNESQGCDVPSCEPCDSYIYLNVSGDCGCACGAPAAAPIGSVTLFNKRSVSKLVSVGCPDTACVSVSTSAVIEFDLNKYCIDTTDVSLDKILKLDFCTDGPNVNLYIDIDVPGGIKFTSEGKKCNVEFTVSASTQTHQYILNFGSILDPVELTNLKYSLSLDCYYPSAKFKNPFDTKITNTYLRGGDHVKFIVSNPKNIRQAVTADVPTVFRLNRRLLDVAVGCNNLTVLVGGLACPNELFAIGSNCYGELGLGSNESIISWKQLNRCQFDCQVSNIFAGKYVTFYVTQSQNVYAVGRWKQFVHSSLPTLIKSICQTWKIKQISISNNHIVFLGSDGCIFGLGENNVGELGLGHLESIPKPVPLVFFYKLNGVAAKQLRDNLDHSLESKNKRHPNKLIDKFRPECFNEKDTVCTKNNRHYKDNHRPFFNDKLEEDFCDKCESDPCECKHSYAKNNYTKRYVSNNRSPYARYGRY